MLPVSAMRRNVIMWSSIGALLLPSDVPAIAAAVHESVPFEAPSRLLQGSRPPVRVNLEASRFIFLDTTNASVEEGTTVGYADAAAFRRFTRESPDGVAV
jgi:hypothetical protein